jgi:hypothetical protein
VPLVKDFIEVTFDIEVCRRELSEFKNLLGAEQRLSEKGDILPFFRQRLHLSAFVASYHPTIVRRTRVLAYEYPLYGDFSADLLIGDPSRNAYCLLSLRMPHRTASFAPHDAALLSGRLAFSVASLKLQIGFGNSKNSNTPRSFVERSEAHRSTLSVSWSWGAPMI